MTEQERPQGLDVTSLHFDVKTGRLVTLLSDESAVQFTLSTNPLRLTFDGRFMPGQISQRQDIVHQAPETPAPAPTIERPTTPEKQPVQTLTGRLKDDVKPGRVDSRGNKTSWAVAALHEEDRETAKMVAVTFHRHTAELALQELHKDDQITIQGYLRPSSNPERMDAFSAFHLINWPNKPQDEKTPQ